MQMAHLIDFSEMSMADWNEVLTTAEDMIRSPYQYSDACKGRVLATVFYEPSTRTRFSFQAAMLRLGGSYLGFSDPVSSSVSKGESLRDTIQIVANYADAVVIRHPSDGAACAASLYSRVPVINAGDGGHLHPTQTMTDLLTIHQLKGGLTGHRIGLCGDLLNGRTVHSLIKAMAGFPGNHFYLISTDRLRMPSYILDAIKKTDCTYEEVSSIEDCIGELDILYMTRIQKERFSNVEEYRTQAGVYVLDGEKMKKASKDLIIMHPLPKVDEITDEVDEDPRAVYFKQAEYGMYVRMALLYKLISGAGAHSTPLVRPNTALSCTNPRCITKKEAYLPSLVSQAGVCCYCDGPMYPEVGR